jgi:hypothetical protein
VLVLMSKHDDFVFFLVCFYKKSENRKSRIFVVGVPFLPSFFIAMVLSADSFPDRPYSADDVKASKNNRRRSSLSMSRRSTSPAVANRIITDLENRLNDSEKKFQTFFTRFKNDDDQTVTEFSIFYGFRLNNLLLMFQKL